MSDLVKVEDFHGQLVVNSREVAKNFEKQHKHILEKLEVKRKELNRSAGNSTDINNLKVFLLDNFFEDCYLDSQRKEQRQVLMTRDGFTFLTMGFTGIKADAWKLKYIEAFNKMEETLKNPFKNLSKELQAVILLDQKQQQFETRLSKVENTMTIDYEQSNNLRELANLVVVKGLGGKNSQAYKELSKQTFQAIWRSYKRYFSVNSYKNTAVKDYQKAIEYIGNWEPDYNLKIEINSLNNQFSFAN